MFLFLLALLFSVLFFGADINAAPVVGIDLGSMWYKIAMVQGQTMDIVVNEVGDRKISTVLGLRGKDRSFGNSAERMMLRYPENGYKYVLDLIGKTPEQTSSLDPFLFPYSSKLRVSKGRNAVYISCGEEEGNLLPEEILAMFLFDAFKIASSKAGIKVLDCVIVVPSFFTVYQRRALLDAATLAGVNVLALLNGGTAAGLTYKLNSDHNNETDKRVLFYDMGAGSTKVSIITFKKKIDKQKNKTNMIVQAIGHGWDESLGGREFDLRIAKYFVKQVENSTGEGTILRDKRAMERLIDASRQVKEMLSANKDATIFISDLVPEFDFSSSMTRVVFEKICEDLFNRTIEPIKTALKNAALISKQIDSIEVIGGGVRIPKIIQQLESFLNMKTGRRLNGDEATAMGAAFYAATHSTSFRVRSTIKLYDSIDYAIDVVLLDHKDLGISERQLLLFEAGVRFGTLKGLSFHLPQKRKSYFSLGFVYNSTALLATGSPLGISEVRFSGIPLESEFNYIDSPKVSLFFRLSNQGLIEVEQAVVEFSILTKEKEAKKSDNTTVLPSEHADKDVNSQKPANITEAEDTIHEETGERFVEVRRDKTIALKVELKHLGLLPLSPAQIRTSKAKISEMDRLDELKLKTIEARNTLETNTYSMKEIFNNEEDIVHNFTSKVEKQNILQVLSKVMDWLEQESESATLNQIIEMSTLLNSKTGPIFDRKYEYEHLEQTLIEFNTACQLAFNISLNITDTHEVEKKEIQEFIQFVMGGIRLVGDLFEKHKVLAPYQDPVLKISIIKPKTEHIFRRIKAFLQRPQRKTQFPPTFNKTEHNLTSNTSTTEDTNHSLSHDEL